MSALISAISPSRLLRGVLSLLPRGQTVYVLSGPLRGAKWVLGCGTHGCWLGTYEARNQRELIRLVKPGDCVYDIGANVGFYTLLASKAVGSTGRVLAFEPFPSNVDILSRHLRLNRLTNATLVDAAVSDCERTSRFQTGESCEQGRLNETGELEVRTVTLDAGRARGDWPAPNLMKIDVEGAESQVLAGAKTILSTDRPTILLACHGTSQFQACTDLLRAAGYQITSHQYEPGMYDVLANPPGR